MNWSKDALLNKARLFIERGFASDRESALFPFWSVLALEQLARASLAHVHPSLLADPQGDNILYACGFHTDTPKSVGAKTVYSRCNRVVENFTKAEYDFCMSLTYLRNEELHSGHAAFEDLPTSQWLARYYRVCHLLMSHMGLELSDLLANDEVKAATTMLLADEETVRSEVKEAIGRARVTFEGRAEADRASALATAEESAKKHRSWGGLTATCPACGAEGCLDGEDVSVSETRLEDDLLRWEQVVLPTKFECLACELRLEGYERVEAAGLGGHRTREHWDDPVDYYGQRAIEAYMEPDYGND